MLWLRVAWVVESDVCTHGSTHLVHVVCGLEHLKEVHRALQVIQSVSIDPIKGNAFAHVASGQVNAVQGTNDVTLACGGAYPWQVSIRGKSASESMAVATSMEFWANTLSSRVMYDGVPELPPAGVVNMLSTPWAFMNPARK
jgi:hypothetical protein